MSLSIQFADLSTAMLRMLPAETSHRVGMFALQKGLHQYLPSMNLQRFYRRMSSTVPGIGNLRHPIGLAAGFDKNAECPQAFVDLGFSFVEVGTVTLSPQLGNSKPRMFRLKEQRAIINRMGFNNHGSVALQDRLGDLRWAFDQTPLGVNIGRGKLTANEAAHSEYQELISLFLEKSSYMVINISSPNTPNLRELATPEFLQLLVSELSPTQISKIWLKFDPDLEKKHFQSLIAKATELNYGGIILTNTHRVQQPHQGGLSGHPITTMSNLFLQWAYEVHGGKLPMVGVGGILSGRDIFEKIKLGASCVQIYSALVYRGPYVVYKLLTELQEEMDLVGAVHLDEVRGTYY